MRSPSGRATGRASSPSQPRLENSCRCHDSVIAPELLPELLEPPELLVPSTTPEPPLLVPAGSSVFSPRPPTLASSQAAVRAKGRARSQGWLVKKVRKLRRIPIHGGMSCLFWNATDICFDSVESPGWGRLSDSTRGEGVSLERSRRRPAASGVSVHQVGLPTFRG